MGKKEWKTRTVRDRRLCNLLLCICIHSCERRHWTEKYSHRLLDLVFILHFHPFSSFIFFFSRSFLMASIDMIQSDSRRKKSDRKNGCHSSSPPPLLMNTVSQLFAMYRYILDLQIDTSVKRISEGEKENILPKFQVIKLLTSLTTWWDLVT